MAVAGPESTRLAEFSRAVRESTLKRLRLVLGEMVNWRPIEGAMSFAEQALHLMECDRYLFDKLDDKVVQPVDGPTDRFEATSQSQYSSLVTDIERTGRQRAGRLEKLSEVDFSRRLDDRRFGGEVTLWWLVVRGNLDHEIHHRGQLAAYLRMSGIVKD